MAKSNVRGEEGKSDDLEIVSIGAIYSGPWDKKYWSSSRGKDRYPYPLGYKAIRAHNGNKYKMEIQEGPKGPLFLITHAGESCSGQTPNIAWEKFQKTDFSHLKIWHGKRHACKIDGVEFFGFKNPLVQRLLRELVANINGTAENISLASSSRAGVSKMRVDEGYSVKREYPNLLSHLDRLAARKKRSRRSEIVCQKSAGWDGLKKPRPQDPCELTSVLPHKLHANTLATEENQCPSSEDPLKMESSDLFVNPWEAVVPIQDVCRLPSPEICKPRPVLNFPEELGGLQDVEHKVVNSLMVTKCRAGDAPVLRESQDMSRDNLCAPDTLDSLQDNTTSCILNLEENTTRQLKEESTTVNLLSSKGLTLETQTKELAESSLNMNSEKSDSDSASQEIDKSMMKLLLPQAIPLLKKASNRRQKKNTTLGTPFSRLNPAENGKSCHLADITASGVSPNVQACNADDGSMHMVAPDSDVNAPDFTTTGPIVPYSFDESHLDIHRIDHIMSSSKKAHLAKFSQLPIIQEQDVAVNAGALPASDLESSRSKDIYSYEDVHPSLEENVLEDNIKKPMSVLQSTSPTKRTLSEGSQDLSGEAEGKLLRKQKHYKSKDKFDRLLSVEGEDSIVETRPTQIGSDTRVKHKVYTRKRVFTSRLEKNRNPSSESDNRCKNVGENSIAKVSPPMKQVISTHCKPDKTDLVEDEIWHEGQQLHCFNFLSTNTASQSSQDGRSVHGLENANIPASTLPASDVENSHEHHENNTAATKCHYMRENAYDKSMCEMKELSAGSDFKLPRDIKINNELERTVELLGCYFHPMPILSVLVKPIGDEIYICVSCGTIADRFRTLFVYKLAAKEPNRGSPSFIGHTPAILPSVDDKSSRYKAPERFGLQLTPDGLYLILFDRIKIPYCREGKIDCVCYTCKSACFEENTVRIVQVKRGHVSFVTKLKAVDNVLCLVACDPNHLIAAGKSGRLIVWIMNSSWSGAAEEFIISASPSVSSCIVELKKIPKSPHFVVGHNGAGEFTVWDISKRVLVSRFSSSCRSVYDFIPISMFAWPGIFNHSTLEDDINRILAATKLWCSNQTDNHNLDPTKGKDTAIWILVSTAADSDAQSGHISSDSGENPSGCWRLALLVENAVIMGCQLESRAAVAGATFGHGIIGTKDGVVCMWDLSTGAKLGCLHAFKGHRASCISTDDSGWGYLCIASDSGQLLVYFHHEKAARYQ